ncbi:MAG: Stf0 family sulfotransferase, partial [Caulobacteraceae bacterium]
MSETPAPSIVAASPPSTSVGLGEAASRRLSVFVPRQVESVRGRLPLPVATTWPTVEGFLAILFTPRCGSTFFARELVRGHDIGHVGETFNTPRLKTRTGADVVRQNAGRWFGAKLSIQGLMAANLNGTIDQYDGQIHFIILLRRDVVAQAVSLNKARQTQRWHSTGKEREKDIIYDANRIGNSVRSIVATAHTFAKFVDICSRPVYRFYYEDSVDGDFSAMENVCKELRIPQVESRKNRNFASLQPIRDHVNEEWRVRFLEHVDPRVQAAIDRYQALL